MDWNGIPLVIFGYGGISKETYLLINKINEHNNDIIYDFKGFIGTNENQIGLEIIDGHKVIATDNTIFDYTKRLPIVGLVIPIGNPIIKYNIYNQVQGIENAIFPNIIHPYVEINKKNVLLGIGNIITAGVKITCDIKIGNFNLINLNCTIGHDVKIGNFNVINPSVSISGNIVLNDKCLIGTGAKVLQELSIGNDSIIGAGAVVVKNVEENTTVVGIPAKPILRKQGIS